MGLPPDINITDAIWPDDQPLLRRIRHRVFVEEQGVPEALEWDTADSACRHVLACTRTGEAVGTARLLPGGRIGRMAVLPEWRRRGIGRAMLDHLVELARREGLERLELFAQTHAIRFYERAGFHARGDTFLEAGIPHRHMQLSLDGAIPETRHER